jgi:iron complex transport system substrate-binding protein
LLPIAPRLRIAALAAVLALAGGCGRADVRADASAEGAITLTDDAGRTVTLPRPARRIVSLVPSATATLVGLGAAGQLVGRTDFDTDPALDSLPSVGIALDPNLEKLASLRPDLVIGWETHKPQLRERLAGLGIPVFAVKTEDTTDVFRAVRNLGRLAGRAPTADSMATRLRGELESVRASVEGLPRPSVFFVVWNDPPMTAGPGTFVMQLIGVAGGKPVFPEVTELWPTVSMEEIVRRQPDVVVIPVGESGTPRFDARSPGWRELRAMRGPVLIPAELVNLPGPGIGETARRLRDALHPERAGR